MAHHNLKIETKYLLDIVKGRKQFEIRKNDRDYQVGDTVTVSNGLCCAILRIKYITDYAQQDGYVVFGFYHLAGGRHGC